MNWEILTLTWRRCIDNGELLHVKKSPNKLKSRWTRAISRRNCEWICGYIFVNKYKTHEFCFWASFQPDWKVVLKYQRRLIFTTISNTLKSRKTLVSIVISDMFSYMLQSNNIDMFRHPRRPYRYYRLLICRGYIRYDSAHSTINTMAIFRSDLHSRTTPHTSALRASYGVSFVSYTETNDRDVSRAHCIQLYQTSAPSAPTFAATHTSLPHQRGIDDPNYRMIYFKLLTKDNSYSAREGRATVPVYEFIIWSTSNPCHAIYNII